MTQTKIAALSCLATQIPRYQGPRNPTQQPSYPETQTPSNPGTYTLRTKSLIV